MAKLEHRRQPLLSRAAFQQRVLRHIGIFALMILGALGIGVVGYHESEGLPWIDALVNASMILGGMGPVNTLQTTSGKLFASGYALFSGLVFVAAIGVLFVPLFHRFLHRFHIGTDEEE